MNTGVGSLSLLQGNLPKPGAEPGSPAFQADSLLSEPPGKPMNTGVGTLSLLQSDLPNPGTGPPPRAPTTSSTAAATAARLAAWAWAPVLPLHAGSLTRKAPLAQILGSLAQISTGHG